jgi:hypothetical protein
MKNDSCANKEMKLSSHCLFKQMNTQEYDRIEQLTSWFMQGTIFLLVFWLLGKLLMQ